MAGQEPSWTCFNPTGWVGGSEGFHGRGRLPLPEQAARTTATLGQDRGPVVRPVRPPSLPFNPSAPLPSHAVSNCAVCPSSPPIPHLPSVSIKSVLRRCPGVWGYYFPRKAATPCREQRKRGFFTPRRQSRQPRPSTSHNNAHSHYDYSRNPRADGQCAEVHYASTEGTKKTDTPRQLLTLVGASLRLNSRQTPWRGAGQPRPSAAWWCRAEGT